MSEEEDFYVLSAEAHHEQDVKGLASIPNNGIASASRDTTVATWYQNATPMEDFSHEKLTSGMTFNGHQGFVNAVVYHPGVPFLDNTPCLVSASNDNHIIFWDLHNTGMMLAVLDGHSKPVKSLAVLTNGDVVSGSWDHTCCVWSAQDGQRKITFSGHSNSVTNIAVMPGTNTVLSASGDRSIIAWEGTTGAILRKFSEGLKDSVQAVAPYDDTSFVSAGNDCAVTRWSLDSGAKLEILQGHSAFIYAVAVHPETKEIATASEDRTVKIWRGGQNVQSLQHPRLIWNVAYSDPIGADARRNVISACEDGFVRVWSTNVAAMASPETIDRLEQLISANAPKPAEMAKATANALDSIEALMATQGSHEGEKKMVRNGNEVDVYAWSNGAWEKVGTVVAGPEGGGGGGGGDTISVGGAGDKPQRGPKQPYNGQMWDYLLDVSMQGSGQSLKLPYNAGTSVFDAAQMFIYDNAAFGVSQEDKEAIVRHICDSITEEDLALIGGAAGTSATSSAGGGGGTAFSDFAKESEELKKQGVQETKSWGQRMKEMKAEGAEVAFSTYAQEGKELEQQQQGQQSGGGATLPADVSACVITTPELFTGLSASQVVAKLTEAVGGSTSEADIASIVQHVISYSEGNSSAADLPVSAVFNWLQVSAAGLKFPALDVLRCILSRGTGDHPDLPQVVATVAQSIATGSVEGDAEKIVSLRLLANAIGTGSANLVEAIIGTPDFFAGLRTNIGTNPAKAPLRVAIIALLKNLALYLNKKTEEDPLSESLTPAVEDIFAAAASWLVFASNSQEKIAFLSIAVTLHASGASVISALANDAGSRLLIGAAKSLKNFGDPVVMMLAKDLYHRYNVEPEEKLIRV